jgi:4-aminobutyrate aminotransferase-like enzyme
MGDRMHKRLRALKSRWPQIGAVDGKGLVAGLACVKPSSREPDGDLAFDVVRACLEKGVLMFSPVGLGSATVKIAPPLTITAEAIDESCDVLEEAFAESLRSSRALAG